MLRSEASLPVHDPNTITQAHTNNEQKLILLQNKVDKLISEMSYLRRQNAVLIDLVRQSLGTHGDVVTSGSPVEERGIKLATVIRMSGSIASFVYSWLTVEPWNLPKSREKSEQTLMSELCSTLAILKIVYGKPICIAAKPNGSHDSEAMSEWKEHIRIFAENVMIEFNKKMSAIDRKKDTSKASGVRNRFERCHHECPEFAVIIRTFAKLRAEGQIVDTVTPLQYQKEGNKLLKFLPLLHNMGFHNEDEV